MRQPKTSPISSSASNGGEDRLADALGVPGADPEHARVEATRIGEAVVRIAAVLKARRTT